MERQAEEDEEIQERETEYERKEKEQEALRSRSSGFSAAVKAAISSPNPAADDEMKPQPKEKEQIIQLVSHLHDYPLRLERHHTPTHTSTHTHTQAPVSQPLNQDYSSRLDSNSAWIGSGGGVRAEAGPSLPCRYCKLCRYLIPPLHATYYCQIELRHICIPCVAKAFALGQAILLLSLGGLGGFETSAKRGADRLSAAPVPSGVGVVSTKAKLAEISLEQLRGQFTCGVCQTNFRANGTKIAATSWACKSCDFNLCSQCLLAELQADPTANPPFSPILPPTAANSYQQQQQRHNHEQQQYRITSITSINSTATAIASGSSIRSGWANLSSQFRIRSRPGSGRFVPTISLNRRRCYNCRISFVRSGSQLFFGWLTTEEKETARYLCQICLIDFIRRGRIGIGRNSDSTWQGERLKYLSGRHLHPLVLVDSGRAPSFFCPACTAYCPYSRTTPSNHINHHNHAQNIIEENTDENPARLASPLVPIHSSGLSNTTIKSSPAVSSSLLTASPGELHRFGMFPTNSVSASTTASTNAVVSSPSAAAFQSQSQSVSEDKVFLSWMRVSGQSSRPSIAADAAVAVAVAVSDRVRIIPRFICSSCPNYSLCTICASQEILAYSLRLAVKWKPRFNPNGNSPHSDMIEETKAAKSASRAGQLPLPTDSHLVLDYGSCPSLASMQGWLCEICKQLHSRAAFRGLSSVSGSGTPVPSTGTTTSTSNRLNSIANAAPVIGNEQTAEVINICVSCVLSAIRSGAARLVKPVPRLPFIAGMRGIGGDGHTLTDGRDFTPPILLPLHLPTPLPHLGNDSYSSSSSPSRSPFPRPVSPASDSDSESAREMYVTIVSPSQAESVCLCCDLNWPVAELERRSALLFDSRSLAATDRIIQQHMQPNSVLIQSHKSAGHQTQQNSKISSASSSSSSSNCIRIPSQYELSEALTPPQVMAVVNLLRENQDLCLGYQNDWEWLELHVADGQFCQYKHQTRQGRSRQNKLRSLNNPSRLPPRSANTSNKIRPQDTANSMGGTNHGGVATVINIDKNNNNDDIGSNNHEWSMRSLGVCFEPDLAAIAANLNQIRLASLGQRNVHLFCGGKVLCSNYPLAHYSAELSRHTVYVLIGKKDSSVSSMSLASSRLYYGPYIETPQGKGESFGIFARHEESSSLIRINVLPATSIEPIRKLISQHLAQSPDQLLLCYFGRLLYDDDSVAACGLIGGSMIVVMSVLPAAGEALSLEYQRGSHVCAARLVSRDTLHDCNAIHLALTMEMESIVAQPDVVAPLAKLFKSFARSAPSPSAAPLRLTAAETEDAVQTLLHLLEEYVLDQDDKDIRLVCPALRPLSSSRGSDHLNGFTMDEILVYLLDTLIEVFERSFVPNLFFPDQNIRRRRINANPNPNPNPNTNPNTNDAPLPALLLLSRSVSQSQSHSRSLAARDRDGSAAPLLPPPAPPGCGYTYDEYFLADLLNFTLPWFHRFFVKCLGYTLKRSQWLLHQSSLSLETRKKRKETQLLAAIQRSLLPAPRATRAPLDRSYSDPRLSQIHKKKRARQPKPLLMMTRIDQTSLLTHHDRRDSSDTDTDRDRDRDSSRADGYYASKQHKPLTSVPASASAAPSGSGSASDSASDSDGDEDAVSLSVEADRYGLESHSLYEDQGVRSIEQVNEHVKPAFKGRDSLAPSGQARKVKKTWAQRLLLMPAHLTFLILLPLYLPLLAATRPQMITSLLSTESQSESQSEWLASGSGTSFSQPPKSGRVWTQWILYHCNENWHLLLVAVTALISVTYLWSVSLIFLFYYAGSSVRIVTPVEAWLPFLCFLAISCFFHSPVEPLHATLARFRSEDAELVTLMARRQYKNREELNQERAAKHYDWYSNDVEASAMWARKQLQKARLKAKLTLLAMRAKWIWLEKDTGESLAQSHRNSLQSSLDSQSNANRNSSFSSSSSFQSRPDSVRAASDGAVNGHSLHRAASHVRPLSRAASLGGITQVLRPLTTRLIADTETVPLTPPQAGRTATAAVAEAVSAYENNANSGHLNGVVIRQASSASASPPDLARAESQSQSHSHSHSQSFRFSPLQRHLSLPYFTAPTAVAAGDEARSGSGSGSVSVSVSLPSLNQPIVSIPSSSSPWSPSQLPFTLLRLVELRWVNWEDCAWRAEKNREEWRKWNLLIGGSGGSGSSTGAGGGAASNTSAIAGYLPPLRAVQQFQSLFPRPTGFFTTPIPALTLAVYAALSLIHPCYLFIWRLADESAQFNWTGQESFIIYSHFFLSMFGLFSLLILRHYLLLHYSKLQLPVKNLLRLLRAPAALPTSTRGPTNRTINPSTTIKYFNPPVYVDLSCPATYACFQAIWSVAVARFDSAYVHAGSRLIAVMTLLVVLMLAAILIVIIEGIDELATTAHTFGEAQLITLVLLILDTALIVPVLLGLVKVNDSHALQLKQTNWIIPSTEASHSSLARTVSNTNSNSNSAWNTSSSSTSTSSTAKSGPALLMNGWRGIGFTHCAEYSISDLRIQTTTLDREDESASNITSTNSSAGSRTSSNTRTGVSVNWMAEPCPSLTPSPLVSVSLSVSSVSGSVLSRRGNLTYEPACSRKVSPSRSRTLYQ